jgi:HAE1 family hydrophobic/amphiphilic exporter-1
MGVAIIGGLVTSTALTLGIVPVVYSLLDGLRGRFRPKAAPVAAEEDEDSEVQPAA